MPDPITTVLSNPAVALAADKAFDLAKDFVTGRLQSRREAEEAWEHIEASITAAYDWIGRGELRKLRVHPDVERELALAAKSGWKPSAEVLLRSLGQVCQAEGISVEGRALSEVVDRLIFLWTGSFTVGTLGALADVRQEMQARDRQDTRNISLAYQETVQAQRTAAQEVVHQQLELAKRYIDEGRYDGAWDVLQLTSSIPQGFGWTDELRYALMARLGCCHLVFGRGTEAKAAFTEARHLRPDYPQAITNLVIARDLCDDPVGESLEMLQPVLDASPILPEAVHTRANLLLTLGQPQEAIKVLERQAELLGDLDTRRDYALTNAYRMAGNLERAEALARECLSREPNEPEAYEVLGDVLLSQAITSPTSHGLANTVLSDLKIDRNRLREAAGAFSRAANGYGTQSRSVAVARCLVNGGLCLLELGELDAAREAYERASGTQPPKPILLPTLRGLARVALSQGDLDTARRRFAQAVELEPSDLSTIYNLCLTLGSAREYGAALDQLRPLQDHPELPDALQVDAEALRAQILWHQAEEGETGAAQRAEAEAILTEVLDRFPDAWQALIERAQWRLASNQDEEALSLIKQALALAPDNLLVLEIAARTTLAQDLWNDFAEISQHLIECNKAAGRPNSSALYHNCAAAHVNVGKVQEALAILDSAQSEPFSATDLMDMRAAVLARLHQHRDARDCWRRLLDVEPDDVRGLVGLSQAEWNLFNLDEAYRLLVRAYDLGDTDPLTCLNIATVCREMGAAPEAVRWAETAVAAGTEAQPELLMNAISAAREAGRQDLASAWLQTFRTKWPESPLLWVREAATREELVQQQAELEAIRAEQVRSAWLAYQCEPIPLSRLAQETGTSLPSVWERIVLSGDPDLDIRCHTGTPEDDALQTTTAFEADEITTDLTALLTLDYLGHLYLLPRMYRVVTIADGFLLKLRNSTIRIPDASVQLRLRRIIEFLTRNRVVNRVGLTGNDPIPDLEQVTEGIGQIGVLPLLTGLERRIALLSDEMSLQWAARNRGTTSFGICGLLKAALRKGLIDEPEYKRSIRLLYAGSYSSIPFTSEFLAETIRSDPSPDNRAARKMLTEAKRPTAERKGCAEVLALTLKSIWSEWIPGYDDLREPWVATILENIHGGDPERLWLRWAVYRCSVNLCRDSDDQVAAGCIRSIIDWATARGLPLDELANVIGQGARDVSDDPGRVQQYVEKLTSGCAMEFQEIVMAHSQTTRISQPRETADTPQSPEPQSS